MGTNWIGETRSKILLTRSQLLQGGIGCAESAGCIILVRVCAPQNDDHKHLLVDVDPGHRTGVRTSKPPSRRSGGGRRQSKVTLAGCSASPKRPSITPNYRFCARPWPNTSSEFNSSVSPALRARQALITIFIHFGGPRAHDKHFGIERGDFLEALRRPGLTGVCRAYSGRQ
jgi:hypothetical protein